MTCVRFTLAARRVLRAALICLSIIVAGTSGIRQGAAIDSTAKPGARSRGDVRVHDPSMIKSGGTYYVFSTGSPDGRINNGMIQIRASENMIDWRFVGTVFDDAPAWIATTLGSKPRSLWAPEIVRFGGEYRLYYSASFFGKNDSLVALATNRTLDPQSKNYKWVDRGIVIRSTSRHDWNAIDPHVSFDEKRVPWMSLGSFWSGIKLRRLDARTGKLSEKDSTLYSIAARPTPRGGGAIEAPAIVRRGRWYHLIVSFDFCCRGVKSDYKIVTGRARRITGPYLDKQGRRMDQGGGDVILAGEARRPGVGGQSVYEDGKVVRLIYHYYDAADAGKSKLQIDELGFTPDDRLIVVDRSRE